MDGDTENELTIIWDTDINVQAVRDHVDSLLRGYKCSTGCSTRRCGCNRRGKHCLVGCQCLNCTNTTNTAGENDKEAHILSLEEDVEAGKFTDREGDDILDWVFGQEIDNICSQSESDEENYETESN